MLSTIVYFKVDYFKRDKNEIWNEEWRILYWSLKALFDSPDATLPQKILTTDWPLTYILA